MKYKKTQAVEWTQKQNQQTKWVSYHTDWNFKKEPNRNSGDEKLNKRDQERSSEHRK